MAGAFDRLRGGSRINDSPLERPITKIIIFVRGQEAKHFPGLEICFRTVSPFALAENSPGRLRKIPAFIIASDIYGTVAVTIKVLTASRIPHGNEIRLVSFNVYVYVYFRVHLSEIYERGPLTSLGACPMPSWELLEIVPMFVRCPLHTERPLRPGTDDAQYIFKGISTRAGTRKRPREYA